MSMLGFETFEALYKSDLQGVIALVVVPALFLVYLLVGPRFASSRGVVPSAGPFVHAWAIVFSIQTILDPIATGLLPRWLGFADSSLATVVLVAFVIAGDFRVLVLLFHLARPSGALRGAAGEAAAWALVVPVTAAIVNAALHAAFPGLPGQSIWLVYEIAFALLALFLRFGWLPPRVPEGARRGYLEDLLEYVTGYYLLWAAADVLILVAGWDAGWAFRIIPNQLYYSFTVPFAYFRFFTAKEQEKA